MNKIIVMGAIKSSAIALCLALVVFALMYCFGTHTLDDARGGGATGLLEEGITGKKGLPEGRAVAWWLVISVVGLIGTAFWGGGTAFDKAKCAQAGKPFVAGRGSLLALFASFIIGSLVSFLITHFEYIRVRAPDISSIGASFAIGGFAVSAGVMIAVVLPIIKQIQSEPPKQ